MAGWLSESESERKEGRKEGRMEGRNEEENGKPVKEATGPRTIVINNSIVFNLFRSR